MQIKNNEPEPLNNDSDTPRGQERSSSTAYRPPHLTDEDHENIRASKEKNRTLLKRLATTAGITAAYTGIDTVLETVTDPNPSFYGLIENFGISGDTLFLVPLASWLVTKEFFKPQQSDQTQQS